MRPIFLTYYDLVSENKSSAAFCTTMVPYAEIANGCDCFVLTVRDSTRSINVHVLSNGAVLTN